MMGTSGHRKTHVETPVALKTGVTVQELNGPTKAINRLCSVHQVCRLVTQNSPPHFQIAWQI